MFWKLARWQPPGAFVFEPFRCASGEDVAAKHEDHKSTIILRC
jgi:hypothetical protein